MVNRIETDICVIGGGSGGLSVAAGAVQMGARTVLVERGKMGGDCLNYGCIPSKSLIAAAHERHHLAHAPITGAQPGDVSYPFVRVRDHIRQVIASIEPHDSVERFEGLGVRVVQGSARFLDRATVAVEGYEIKAKKFVVATGSRPAVPPIPGVEDVQYDTNETFFDHDRLPRHLLVIGGGPIGCELAQAYRRLGAAVSLIDIGPILVKDDPDQVEVVRRSLVEDGIDLFENAKLARLESGPVAVVEQGGVERRIKGDRLLIAAGRRPNVEELNLESAGIEVGKSGIRVDRRLRTTNKNVFAIGDVAGGLQFTHVAGHHAGIVIRNALFRLPARADRAATPWVTYTSPEIAQVGLSQADAQAQNIPHQIQSWSFEQNDRALSEGDTRGGIKVVVKPNGKILGASIVGRSAGDLIAPWVLAIDNKLSISALAGMIAPYPTRTEISKRAAGSYYSPKLFSDRTRWLVKTLLKLPF